MGFLKEVWDINEDPDGVSPYTPYSFIPVNAIGPIDMSLGMDFTRKEAIASIPMSDGALDFLGRTPGRMDVRYLPFSFRMFIFDEDLDKARDLLVLAIGSGYPVRLVYQTDSGAQWFTVGSNPKIQQSFVSANRGGGISYIDFTVTWRIRPDWQWRWRESAEFFRGAETFSPAHDEVFGTAHRVTVTSGNTFFNIDTRGTVGFDAPTILDTGSHWTFTGPLGGDSGFDVYAYHSKSRVKDKDGVLQWSYFRIPFKLPTSAHVARVLFDSQTFSSNLPAYNPFRVYKPDYQVDYVVLQPNDLNLFSIIGRGDNVVTGGTADYDWLRRRA